MINWRVLPRVVIAFPVLLGVALVSGVCMALMPRSDRDE